MPVLDDEHYGRLIKSLSSWTFEPHKLLPDEVLTCAYILFEAIFRIDGMSEDCGAELKQMPLFLNALQQTYRQVNNYHNFEHALDVFQAIYCILRWEGLVPELSILLGNETWTRRTRDKRGLIDCLNNSDIFTLCVAAVGHDVGHPGLTNAFMVCGTPIRDVRILIEVIPLQEKCQNTPCCGLRRQICPRTDALLPPSPGEKLLVCLRPAIT